MYILQKFVKLVMLTTNDDRLIWQGHEIIIIDVALMRSKLNVQISVK